MSILVKDLGLIDYQQALNIQHEYVERKQEVLLVCEHPLVITVGRGKESQTDILNPQINCVEVSRGGRATLHLPGQVVFYPIMNTIKRNLDALSMLRLLENTIIETLADFRIAAQAIEGKTGVWVDEGKRKIASIGIAIKNEMSFHGLALNVVCDLKEFKNLKPCGFDASVMTSMKKEIASEYWKVWNLTDESLMARVRLRIPENFMSAIDSGDNDE